MVSAPDLSRIDVVADGGVLRIRRKRSRDFASDYAWRTDPETARLDGSAGQELTFAEYVALVERDVLFPGPARQVFSIETAAGEHIGNAMYYNAGHERDAAALGMTIGRPDYRERGAGAYAMVLFVRYLWSAHPFRLLSLRTLEWNERAIRAFRRAGFSETAVVERAGQRYVEMEARREWWLMWDGEGRFAAIRERAFRLLAAPTSAPGGPRDDAGDLPRAVDE